MACQNYNHKIYCDILCKSLFRGFSFRRLQELRSRKKRVQDSWKLQRNVVEIKTVVKMHPINTNLRANLVNVSHFHQLIKSTIHLAPPSYQMLRFFIVLRLVSLQLQLPQLLCCFYCSQLSIACVAVISYRSSQRRKNHKPFNSFCVYVFGLAICGTVE